MEENDTGISAYASLWSAQGLVSMTILKPKCMQWVGGVEWSFKMIWLAGLHCPFQIGKDDGRWLVGC